MTGRHDEPQARRDAQWYPPGTEPAQPAQAAQAGRAAQPAQAGQPAQPRPHAPHGPPPSAQAAWPQGDEAERGSGPEHVPDYGSGPQHVDYGPEPPAAYGPSGPYQIDPQHPSGPYRVEHPSGPQRVDPYQQPAGQPPYPAAAAQPAQNQPPQTQQPVPPGQPVPGQAAPAQPVPGQPAPGQPAPGQPAPGQPAPGQPALGQPGYPGPYPPHAPGGNAHDLSSAQLLRQGKRPPQSGWRRAVYVASGHSVNLGESRADRVRRELIARINQPLNGCYKIATLSLKGGVGKTTSTAALGSTFASLRGDRVVAVDANPDRGTLSQKIPLETTATVRHLLRDAQRIRRYSDVRAYTSQGPSRLEVLASEQDPAVSEAFSENDYRRTVNLLEHFYNILLTDCGTGLMHSAMKGVLELADSLVIVSSGSIDGARSASATLDWLDAHGYRLLVARSVVVINSVRPRAGKVDLNKVSEHFAARSRAVCRIPFDPHFEEGAEVELDQLQAPTRLALLELAATVADDFPQASRRGQAR